MKRIVFLLLIFSNIISYGQCDIPIDFEQQKHLEYDNLTDNDGISWSDYWQSAQEEYCRLKDLIDSPSHVYDPLTNSELSPRSASNPCENGGFEMNSFQDWRLAFGRISHSSNTNPPHFSPFTAGSRYHTIESSGTDPIVGISKLPPNGGSHSVRLGDSRRNYDADLISKTYTVSSNNSIITFWYATILEFCNGNIPITGQAAFRVRVFDGTTDVSAGTVNIGNGTNIIRASTNDPFLTEHTAGSRIYFRDWQCATIDLSQYVGKTVTIEFIANDCSAGGHYGYTYLDNFCGSCADNNFSLSSGISSKCGSGTINVNYRLPTIGASVGTLDIELLWSQNGGIGTSITKVTKNSGTSHSFSLNPSALIPSPNSSLKFIDYWVKGTFKLNGTTVGIQYLGMPRSGQVTGNNNDYEIACSSPPPSDCPDECYWKLGGNQNVTSSNNIIGILNQNNLDWRIFTNGSQKAVLTANGNVGIGTPTPSERLHVRDQAIFVDATPTGNNTNTGSIRLYSGNNSGNSGFIEFNTTNQNRIGSIGWNASDLQYQTNNNAGHIFQTQAGTNERMRITANGRVGVNTPTPQAQMHVNGEIRSQSNNTWGHASLNTGSNNISGFTEYWRDPTTRLGYIGWSNNDMRYVADGQGNARHIFETSNAERMRIAANGNIGMGTTNTTSARVHINDGANQDILLGVIPSNNAAGARYNMISLNGQNNINNYTIASRTMNSGLDQHLFINRPAATGSNIRNNIFFRENNASQMTIQGGTGNVGIGTENPGNRTEITGTRISPTTNPNTNNTDNISGLRLTDLNKDNRNLTLAPNSFENVLTVDNDGDVRMVQPFSFGRDCGSTGTNGELSTSRELPLNNFNFIFREGANGSGNAAQNRIGIGEFVGCNLQAKLHVNRTGTSAEANKIGVLSQVFDEGGEFNASAYDGYTTPTNLYGTNFGNRLVVQNGRDNIGSDLWVGTLNMNNTNSIGVRSRANGSNHAIAGDFKAEGGMTENIGVKAFAVTDCPDAIQDVGLWAEVNNSVPGCIGLNDWAMIANGGAGGTMMSFYASDNKLKKDILPLSNAISILDKIEPKKYDFDNDKYPSINLPSQKDNYGVIAQELEKVLPSLVREATFPGKEGQKSETIKLVNYTELIPIAIAAIKELNVKVEKQNNAVIENEALKSKVSTLEDKLALLEKSIAALCESGCGGLKSVGGTTTSDVDALYQSIPNPTDDVAMINYYLTKSYPDASITVSTQDGKQIQSFKLDPKAGNGSIKVSLGDLSSGTYMYTLVAGERIIDTKRLQILK